MEMKITHIIKKFNLILSTSLFFILIAFSTKVFAEYYVTYPEMYPENGTPCCSGYKKPSCKVHHKAKRHYVVRNRCGQRSRCQMSRYYVWSNCCGDRLVRPVCSDCVMASPCQSQGCYYPQFYVPSDYYDRNWDMRTADDVYDEVDH